MSIAFASAQSRYTSVAIILHWVIAALIIGQIAGGLLMVNLGESQSALKFELFQWHKSFGITILVLTFIRIAWRLTHRPPALPQGLKSYERALARLTHVGFYVLLVSAPVAGWALVSASPFAASVQTYLFGFIHLPHLPFFEGLENRREVAGQIAEVHKLIAFVMIGLLVLHIGAALKHHFLDRDGVLLRMAPFLARRKSIQS